MGTCIREGQSYKRHWWNDEGICELCGHKSPWALYMEQERKQIIDNTLSALITNQQEETKRNETILEMTDRIIDQNRKEESDVKSNNI